MSVKINDFYIVDMKELGNFEAQKKYLEYLQRNRAAGLLKFQIIS
jgi:hypothetical protein